MTKTKILSNFKIWQSLMDTSVFFFLAGQRFKGYSEEEGWKKFCEIWKKDSQEHRLTDLKIIQKLYGRTKNKY